MEIFIKVILSLLGVYFLVGCLFASAFVVKGIKTVDPSTKNASVIFKIMVFPGSVGLWPVLLRKWMKAK